MTKTTVTGVGDVDSTEERTSGGRRKAMGMARIPLLTMLGVTVGGGEQGEAKKSTGQASAAAAPWKCEGGEGGVCVYVFERGEGWEDKQRWEQRCDGTGEAGLCGSQGSLADGRGG